MRLHEDELPIDEALARRVLREQFPAWAELALEAPREVGTSHVIFRLGERMSLRLPRTVGAAAQVAKDAQWLPVLAPALTLEVPEVLGVGTASAAYPVPFVVTSWIDGAPVVAAELRAPEVEAGRLGAFVRALQAVDASEGPRPGESGSDRGADLLPRDAQVRACIAELGARIDGVWALAQWERALAAPEYEGPPVWVHGDLLSGNLLMQAGMVVGVIDFGLLGVGDPACDLLPAWCVFDGASRLAFRDAFGADDAMWERGRGWALSNALIALPYYLGTGVPLLDVAWRMLDALRADQ